MHDKIKKQSLLFFMVYATASSILLRYPWILYNKRKMKFKAVHISHRGGCYERLENTLGAFINAEQCGTDMLELDCQLTADQVVVVSHDNNLKRQCDRNVCISETNLLDLPQLKEKIICDFNDGQFSSFRTNEPSEREIVTLDNVFQKFIGMPINIDIKSNNDILIDKVANLITKYNREEITVWGNHSETITQKCYRRLPGTPILFSFRRVVTCVILYYIGMLPFLPIKESCYEISMHRIFLRFPQQSYLAKIRYQILDYLLMNGKMFKYFSERGIQTFIWVLNNTDDFDEAMALGCTGIMTDQPTLLTKYMRDKQIMRGFSVATKIK